MLKIFIFLFCILLSSTEILGAFELLKKIIDTKDSNITRVRTREELYSRSKEFVVLDFIGLVEQYEGYTAEEYDVQTEDGYILKLHRLSGSPLCPKAYGKPVVYLQHGLFGDSDFHVVLGPEQSLAFQLADACYDLWLGNVRGTTYSKKHVKYLPETGNKKFWDFSMDEMGTIDLPKFIDVVLEKTNQKQLIYIGYSMGTTLSYMLLSEKPEYNEKMNLVINIAPAASFTPPHSALVDSFILLGPPTKALARASRVYQLLPQSKLLQIIGENICGSHFGKIFCKAFLYPIVNINNVNFTSLPTVLAYVPAGSSLNAAYHYYQMLISGRFQKYDFGFIKNKLKYGSFRPPEYDMSKITSPQVIYYSESDAYVNARDAKKIKEKLKNVVAFEKIPNREKYNHMDFMLAVNAKTVFYNQLIEIIHTYV